MSIVKYLPLLICLVFASYCKATVICEKSGFNSKITVVTELLPPYQYFDSKGNKTGYSIEIVREILSNADLKVNIDYYPWPRAYKMALKQPNTIIFSILRTPAREDLFQWIGELYLEKYYFYKLATDKDIVETYPGIHNVTAYSGSPFISYLSELGFSNVELTDSVEQAIKMLTSNRADLLFTSDYALVSLLRRMNISRQDIVKVSPQPIFTASLYFATNKNSDPCLIEQLNRSYQSLVNSSQMALLKKQLKAKH